MSTPILDTAHNLLQINGDLLQYFRHFVPSRNPYQARFELPSKNELFLVNNLDVYIKM